MAESEQQNQVAEPEGEAQQPPAQNEQAPTPPQAKTPPPAPVDPRKRREEKLAQRKRNALARRQYRVRLREKRRAAGRSQEGLAPAGQPKEGERQPGRRRIRQGVVTSAKAAKTVTVEISIARRHARYEKIVRRTRKVHAHDEEGLAREGDVVRVVESRPLSRTKRWRLLEVVERAQ